MSKTITQLVQKFVSEDEQWYVDTYDSRTEIGMENKQNFGNLIAALEDRRIEYRIEDSGCGEWCIVDIYM